MLDENLAPHRLQHQIVKELQRGLILLNPLDSKWSSVNRLGKNRYSHSRGEVTTAPNTDDGHKTRNFGFFNSYIIKFRDKRYYTSKMDDR